MMDKIVETLMEDHNMTHRQASETALFMMGVTKKIYEVVISAWEYVIEVVTNVIDYIECETGMTMEEVLDGY